LGSGEELGAEGAKAGGGLRGGVDGDGEGVGSADEFLGGGDASGGWRV